MQGFHIPAAPPLYTNTFLLISDAGHAVVIDPAAEVDSYDEILKQHNATLTTILCTHGHTPGSVVLLCGEHLFCGDTLFAGSIGRTDLEGGSSAQMADSLRKLAQLPIPRETQVLPGHGEFSTFGAELDNNYYIRSALRGGNDIF